MSVLTRPVTTRRMSMRCMGQMCMVCHRMKVSARADYACLACRRQCNIHGSHRRKKLGSDLTVLFSMHREEPVARLRYVEMATMCRRLWSLGGLVLGERSQPPALVAEGAVEQTDLKSGSLPRHFYRREAHPHHLPRVLPKQGHSFDTRICSQPVRILLVVS